MSQAGAPAIATTSAGVSWTLGRGDGQKVKREEMLQVIRAIARTVFGEPPGKCRKRRTGRNSGLF